MTPDAVLHTVVGRAKPARTSAESEAGPATGRPQSSTETFAQRYGYKKWTTDLDVALVSGRHLTWYGPSLVEARDLLERQLAATRGGGG